MTDDALKYLSDKFQEDIKAQSDDLMMGKAKDFSDYKYSAGIIRGLMVANAHIIDLAAKMEGENG